MITWKLDRKIYSKLNANLRQGECKNEYGNNPKKVQSLVEKISEQYPKLAGPFMVFLRRVEEEGVLSTKTKELISVALAVACRCKWCIAFHTKNALDAGATEDEIMEACFVATLMAGGPALMHTQLVLEAIDEFTETKEKIKVPEKATK